MKIFIVQMYELVINEKRVAGERCLKAWLLKLHCVTEPTAMRERELFKLVAQVPTSCVLWSLTRYSTRDQFSATQ